MEETFSLVRIWLKTGDLSKFYLLLHPKTAGWVSALCWISCDWKWMDGSLYIDTISSASISISKLFWTVCFRKSKFNFLKLQLTLQRPWVFRKHSNKTNCTSIVSRWLSTNKSQRRWPNELTEVHGDTTSFRRMLPAHCSFLSCGDLYL